MATFGGERAWRVERKGDIAIAYHWVFGEAAMVLGRANGGGGAFGILQRNAWQYVNNDGYPNLKTCIPAAFDAAEQMGMGTDKSTIHRIVDIITDELPILLSMPPEPDWKTFESHDPIGELIIKQGGKTILEREVDAPTAAEIAQA